MQGSGLVVNICSVSSYIDLPLSAVYCASKAALLSLTNCLRMEVQRLGVHVLGELCALLHKLHKVGMPEVRVCSTFDAGKTQGCSTFKL